MFCSHCGKEASNNSAVCRNCGRLLAGTHMDDYVNSGRDTNGMAIAGFICSFIIPLLGWIFGGIGLARSRDCSGKGAGYSIAAIVIATIHSFILLSLFY